MSILDMPACQEQAGIFFFETNFIPEELNSVYFQYSGWDFQRGLKYSNLFGQEV